MHLKPGYFMSVLFQVLMNWQQLQSLTEYKHTRNNVVTVDVTNIFK